MRCAKCLCLVCACKTHEQAAADLRDLREPTTGLPRVPDTTPAPPLDAEMVEGCADDLEDAVRGLARTIDDVREVVKCLRTAKGGEVVDRLLLVIAERDRTIRELREERDLYSRTLQRAASRGRTAAGGVS